MSRQVRGLVATATIGVALMVAGPARACTTLDLGCTADGVAGAVDEGSDVAGGALGPAGDPIDEVVDDTVDGAVGVIDDVVGRTPDLPVDPEVPEPPGSGGPGAPGDPVPGEGPDGPRGDRPGSDDRRSSDTVTAVGAAAARVPREAIARPTLAIGAASTAQRTAPEPAGGVGGAILAAAPSLAVLAALFGLALAFASVQTALDRRDPRLAVVRASDDVVPFR